MNNNRILKEWLDASGNKIASNNTTTDNRVVYIWDMYIDKFDKGNWLSADYYNGEWQGMVYESKAEALKYGRMHLEELEEEGELRGSPDDYDIDIIEVPILKVSKSTLRFSGI